MARKQNKSPPLIDPIPRAMKATTMAAETSNTEEYKLDIDET